MLSGLPALFKPGFEFAFSRGDDQNADVGLRGAGDHVRHVIFVPGRVQHGVSFLLRREMRFTNLHGFPFRSFLFRSVHDVRHVPRISVFILCFSFVLFDDSLIDLTGEIQNLPSDGRFPGVDVSDKHQVQMFSTIRVFTIRQLFHQLFFFLFRFFLSL